MSRPCGTVHVDRCLPSSSSPCRYRPLSAFWSSATVRVFLSACAANAATGDGDRRCLVSERTTNIGRDRSEVFILNVGPHVGTRH
jgi:hypothetical protein